MRSNCCPVPGCRAQSLEQRPRMGRPQSRRHPDRPKPYKTSVLATALACLALTGLSGAGAWSHNRDLMADLVAAANQNGRPFGAPQGAYFDHAQAQQFGASQHFYAANAPHNPPTIQLTAAQIAQLQGSVPAQSNGAAATQFLTPSTGLIPTQDNLTPRSQLSPAAAQEPQAGLIFAPSNQIGSSAAGGQPMSIERQSDIATRDTSTRQSSPTAGGSAAERYDMISTSLASGASQDSKSAVASEQALGSAHSVPPNAGRILEAGTKALSESNAVPKPQPAPQPEPQVPAAPSTTTTATTTTSAPPTPAPQSAARPSQQEAAGKHSSGDAASSASRHHQALKPAQKGAPSATGLGGASTNPIKTIEQQIISRHASGGQRQAEASVMVTPATMAGGGAAVATGVMSSQSHQQVRLLPYRDSKLLNSLLSSLSRVSTAKASSPSTSSASSLAVGSRQPAFLSALLDGFKSGISSRSSIVKAAISDNKVARTLTSVGKTIGGNKYVAGAGVAAALAALGLTVSKFMSQQLPYVGAPGLGYMPKLSAGESLLSSSSIMHPSFVSGPFAQPPAGPFAYGPSGSYAADSMMAAAADSGPSSASYSLNAHQLEEAAAAQQAALDQHAARQYYLNAATPSRKPAQFDAGQGHYSSFFNSNPPLEQTSGEGGAYSGSSQQMFASESEQQSPPRRHYDSQPQQQYGTYISGAPLLSGPQQAPVATYSDSPAASPNEALAGGAEHDELMRGPLQPHAGHYNLDHLMPAATNPAHRLLTATGRSSAAVVLKLDEATRSLLKQQLQLEASRPRLNLDYFASLAPAAAASPQQQQPQQQQQQHLMTDSSSVHETFVRQPNSIGAKLALLSGSQRSSHQALADETTSPQPSAAIKNGAGGQPKRVATNYEANGVEYKPMAAQSMRSVGTNSDGGAFLSSAQTATSRGGINGPRSIDANANVYFLIKPNSSSNRLERNHNEDRDGEGDEIRQPNGQSSLSMPPQLASYVYHKVSRQPSRPAASGNAAAVTPRNAYPAGQDQTEAFVAPKQRQGFVTMTNGGWQSVTVAPAEPSALVAMNASATLRQRRIDGESDKNSLPPPAANESDLPGADANFERSAPQQRPPSSGVMDDEASGQQPKLHRISRAPALESVPVSLADGAKTMKSAATSTQTTMTTSASGVHATPWRLPAAPSASAGRKQAPPMDYEASPAGVTQAPLSRQKQAQQQWPGASGNLNGYKPATGAERDAAANGPEDNSRALLVQSPRNDVPQSAPAGGVRANLVLPSAGGEYDIDSLETAATDDADNYFGPLQSMSSGDTMANKLIEDKADAAKANNRNSNDRADGKSLAAEAVAVAFSGSSLQRDKSELAASQRQRLQARARNNQNAPLAGDNVFIELLTADNNKQSAKGAGGAENVPLTSQSVSDVSNAVEGKRQRAQAPSDTDGEVGQSSAPQSTLPGDKLQTSRSTNASPTADVGQASATNRAFRGIVAGSIAPAS